MFQPMSFHLRTVKFLIVLSALFTCVPMFTFVWIMIFIMFPRFEHVSSEFVVKSQNLQCLHSSWLRMNAFSHLIISLQLMCQYFVNGKCVDTMLFSCYYCLMCKVICHSKAKIIAVFELVWGTEIYQPWKIQFKVVLKGFKVRAF